MKKNIIVGQSGGPTAVINASLYGVITEGMKHPEEIGCVYGMHNGIEGFLRDDYQDLSHTLSPEELELLKVTPAAYLGSCRYKLPEDLSSPFYLTLFKKLEDLEIGYFFYIGGNDSMDTVSKLSRYAAGIKSDIRFIGIPKTIDNDLIMTDHTPGFASAAKYVATTVREIVLDSSVYHQPAVTIVEIMGRHAGWLTAAAALAKRTPDEAPHLIYLPEVAFDVEKFLQDVQAVYDRLGYCFVVASEGIVDKDGNYIAADGQTDAFGHVQLSGAGETLKNLVEERLGLKARCNTLGTAQRSAMHFASKTDADEAYATGVKAVELALAGKSGVMVTLERQPGEEYVCTLGEAPLSAVANVEKKVPLEWINEEGNYVTEDFIKYARPLIEGEVAVPMKNGLPDYVTIDKTIGRVQK